MYSCVFIWICILWIPKVIWKVIHGSLNVPIFHITQPLGIYMVFFMATFSGDVQYSQNGTFTNPCYLCRIVKLRLGRWNLGLYALPVWMERTRPLLRRRLVSFKSQLLLLQSLKCSAQIRMGQWHSQPFCHPQTSKWPGLSASEAGAHRQMACIS